MDKLKPPAVKTGLMPSKAFAKPAIKPPKVDLQAMKARAQEALGKLRGGAARGADPTLQEYLGLLMSGTEQGAALKDGLVARARDEFERRKHLIAPLQRVLTPFRDPRSQLRLRHDVLRPAEMRRLTSQGVWDAVDWLLDANNKTLPVLGAAGSVMEWAESVFGKLSFSLGVGIEVGAVGGVEHAVAISGLRHHSWHVPVIACIWWLRTSPWWSRSRRCVAPHSSVHSLKSVATCYPGLLSRPCCLAVSWTSALHSATAARVATFDIRSQ
jgi:hypothetical protein